MRNQPQCHSAVQHPIVTGLAASVAALIGPAVLADWALGVEEGQRVLPSLVSMTPAAAILLLLAVSYLWMQRQPPQGQDEPSVSAPRPRSFPARQKRTTPSFRHQHLASSIQLPVSSIQHYAYPSAHSHPAP